MVVALGIEGSANKIGVGIVRYDGGGGKFGDGGRFVTMSNPRKTFLTPPGQGFLPRETAWHHQAHVVGIVREALNEANIKPEEVSWLGWTVGSVSDIQVCRLIAFVSLKGRGWVHR
mmetsp:Transcript_44320/g.70884  ORF Transcript_44320/g.70884 Transcript_44320/m.70884 type:complete len:116 (-) Transcript_44320:1629-1976(-)